MRHLFSALKSALQRLANRLRMSNSRQQSRISHPPVTTSEHKGVRYLHLGTPTEQGAMRLRAPDAIEATYLQQMMLWLLFKPEARQIVQLGLGAATLTKFCYRNCPEAQIVAVELNPAVIDICRAKFALPPDDARLQVLEMNALDFVLDPARHGTIDVLQVDLYDAQARGPVLDSAEFYRACAACLTPDGMMTVNLYGQHLRHEESLATMRPFFDSVMWLPVVHEANVVALACKQAPAIHNATLNARAGVINRQMKLPVKSWVNGLKRWQQEHQSDDL
jgi:spermidine synthase